MSGDKHRESALAAGYEFWGSSVRGVRLGTGTWGGWDGDGWFRRAAQIGRARRLMHVFSKQCGGFAQSETKCRKCGKTDDRKRTGDTKQRLAAQTGRAEPSKVLL